MQDGKFWDFTSDLAKGDTAYTTLALGAHTDNTYFVRPLFPPHGSTVSYPVMRRRTLAAYSCSIYCHILTARAVKHC